ncbi:hypothetical protein PIB30_037842 [Stylosanthes scabra]|uniref:Uncharacterized protein n=1 Tax=Stylosanthes scabra TaxID=79078 RepID=A0ABU6TFW2_9FABA|nr:hypothetical protein [Stylosanthes scabra]
MTNLDDSLLILFASFGSSGNSPFLRKFYIGIIQDSTSEVGKQSISMVDIDGSLIVPWSKERFPDLGLVLANFDRRSAQAFRSLGIWELTTWEFVQTYRIFVLTSSAKVNPANRASYLAWLFEIGNSYRMDCSIITLHDSPKSLWPLPSFGWKIRDKKPS